MMPPRLTFSLLNIRDLVIIWLIATGLICAVSILGGSSLRLAGGASLTLCVFMCGYIYWRLSDLRPGSHTEILDRSLREQARLADGFAEALIIINSRERILYANPAAEHLFGPTEARSSLSNIIRDPEVRGIVADTLAGGSPDPVTLHLETPVERHIRAMSSGIFTEQDTGTVRRAIIVFYDITDLVRVNTMRADFLANASHELKTPVASLLGYIETLRGHAKDDPEAQENFLAIMQQQAERMQRLINDLLSLRRIEMVEHIRPTETADLYLAARAAMESVKPIAKKLGVKIKYDGPKEAPVTGSQDELVQLVLNILDNAMVVTPKGSTVELKLRCNEKWHPRQAYTGIAEFENAPHREIVPAQNSEMAAAVLHVKDSGPGFAPEHLPRLGERFYKIMDHQNPVKRGTGLGLAIVKHIVRRHRGGLFIQSTQGLGTAFTIALPQPDMTP